MVANGQPRVEHVLWQAMSHAILSSILKAITSVHFKIVAISCGSILVIYFAKMLFLSRSPSNSPERPNQDDTDRRRYCPKVVTRLVCFLCLGCLLGFACMHIPRLIEWSQYDEYVNRAGQILDSVFKSG